VLEALAANLFARCRRRGSVPAGGPAGLVDHAPPRPRGDGASAHEAHHRSRHPGEPHGGYGRAEGDRLGTIGCAERRGGSAAI
jgi:hypothetical protein